MFDTNKFKTGEMLTFSFNSHYFPIFKINASEMSFRWLAYNSCLASGDVIVLLGTKEAGNILQVIALTKYGIGELWILKEQQRYFE